MRTFVFTDDKSNKFWNIDLSGTGFTVTFGKLGTSGQTQRKDFPDEDKAQKAHDKLVAEKLGKGYVETTKQTPISPLQQALEASLVENPDDMASHMAYADYLMEQGDPRGEFVQTQLALEDPSRSAAERDPLHKRESELLARHGRTWLGDLGRFLVGKQSGPDKPMDYQFVRGWLDAVRVLPAPEAVLASLANAPQARLLRRLDVVYDMRFHPFELDPFVEAMNKALKGDEKSFDTDEWYDSVTILPHLIGSPHLTNLRAFKLGYSDSADQINYTTMCMPFESCNVEQMIEFVRRNPHLEELYLNTALSNIERLFAMPTLGNLRVLQYFYGSPYTHGGREGIAYPLSALAGNASLSRLTTLRLHAGRDVMIDTSELEAVLRSPHLPSLAHLHVHTIEGVDRACRDVVESGILRRLKTLGLGYGNMTDEGARILAACPDLKRLDLLDVTKSGLSAQGIALLKGTGIRVVADNQHSPDDHDSWNDVDVE